MFQAAGECDTKIENVGSHQFPMLQVWNAGALNLATSQILNTCALCSVFTETHTGVYVPARPFGLRRTSKKYARILVGTSQDIYQPNGAADELNSR